MRIKPPHTIIFIKGGIASCQKSFTARWETMQVLGSVHTRTTSGSVSVCSKFIIKKIKAGLHEDADISMCRVARYETMNYRTAALKLYYFDLNCHIC